MNEVTKIHLGRQQFNVSVEAHRALKDYLSAIKKQIGEQSVVDEVELRMAELLLERGVSGEKVVLPGDVDYLKKQLGNPKDFKEDGDARSSKQDDEEPAAKRFYLDPDHGMIAGVAAGLSNYFGIDVRIIRILFVVGTISGGWGILLYIALWLLVPPAKTSSERLQMEGKPITVESLKEAVDRADVQAAAHRAHTTFVPVVGRVLNILIKLAGLVFIFAGLSALFGLISGKAYMLAHGDKLFQENIFPVGASEHLLLNIGLILGGIVALFAVLSGMAMFKHAWPVRGWITGVLLGIFFVGSALAVALGGDAAPRVRDRYNAANHSIIRPVMFFNAVDVIGERAEIRYEQGPGYSVKINYFGQPDLSKITTQIVNNRLQISTQALDNDRHCTMLCIFPSYNLVITVQSPEGVNLDVPRPDLRLLPSSI